MKVLGINIGHDSGATLIDGNKITAVNEERLSRIKMHHGFPYQSIDEVLSISGCSPSGIDAIMVEGRNIMPQQDTGFDEVTGDWKKRFISGIRLEKFLLGSETGLSLVRTLLKPQVIKIKSGIEKYFRGKEFFCPVQYIDHHYCHAATAYYTQRHDKGLVITLDASGEGYCSQVYVCENNEMKLVHKIPCYHSPAYYYAYITKILGFKPLRHEGKITGLAAFGNPERTGRTFEKYIYYDKNRSSFVNAGGYHLGAITLLTNELKNFSKEDIAAGIQHHTESISCEYVSDMIGKFCGNEPVNLFLAGGLFANVKVNQRLLELSRVKDIYIFPNMGDGGLSMGAALAKTKQKIIIENVYLGRNFSDADVETELQRQKISYRKPENISAEIAKLLAENKVVARFNGAMEYGPRALGNRSIIYSAKDKSVNTWLNQRLRRTEFMPFAPFVRDVDYKEYFHIAKEHISPFKFMTITCNVTEKCRQEAPAITHVDGTARPQIIFRHQNPSYYDILTEYKKLTGCGVLVNTSFNMHEEPIINTPGEAIATFKQGGLDVLAISNYLVE